MIKSIVSSQMAKRKQVELESGQDIIFDGSDSPRKKSRIMQVLMNS